MLDDKIMVTKLRILYRHLDPGQSGAVSSFVKMIEGYCERFPDDDLTVMCTERSPLAKLGRLSNCHVEIVGKKVPREAYLLGAGDIAVWRLNRIRRFDVFWTVNVGLYTRGQVPQVLMVNNSHQVYPSESSVPHPSIKLRLLLLRQCFRRSLRLSSGVIVQTPLMKQCVRQIRGCPTRVVVLPKAVVAENNSSEHVLSMRVMQHVSKANAIPKLLFVATAVPHKNHKILAQMMKSFRQKDSAVRLFVTITRDEWQSLAGNSAVDLVESEHVIPLGWVDKDELGALYEACDACVMPSLLESLSSAHLEAMHWKIPQVVADLPYAHDLCGNSALYADPHDGAAWCRQVERLLGDTSLREQLVKNGAVRLSMVPRSWGEMAVGIREVLSAVAAEYASSRESVLRSRCREERG